MKTPSVVLLLLLILITSCATKVTSLKKDVDLELKVDAGYLLVGVDTNAELESVFIYGADNLRLTQEDLRQGTQFILIDLEAGDYHFDKVRLNHFLDLGLEEGYWDFSIKPGVISYVGHLEVKTQSFLWYSVNSEIELVNRSSEALVFMETQFPNILQNRTLHYAGPGKDPFLRLMQDKGEVVEHE
jgi:hypothetical protein